MESKLKQFYVDKGHIVIAAFCDLPIGAEPPPFADKDVFPDLLMSKWAVKDRGSINDLLEQFDALDFPDHGLRFPHYYKIVALD